MAIAFLEVPGVFGTIAPGVVAPQCGVRPRTRRIAGNRPLVETLRPLIRCLGIGCGSGSQLVCVCSKEQYVEAVDRYGSLIRRERCGPRDDGLAHTQLGRHASQVGEAHVPDQNQPVGGSPLAGIQCLEVWQKGLFDSITNQLDVLQQIGTGIESKTSRAIHIFQVHLVHELDSAIAFEDQIAGGA
jgi:hypothetical protein